MIFGAVIDDALGDEVRVTVIATGFGPARLGAAAAPRSRPTASHEEGAREVAADRFEVSDEILEVPSFLRDG